MRIVRFARHALQRFAAHGDDARLRAVCPDEHIDYGALSAAALADNGGHSLFGEGHAYVFQHVALAVVGESDIFQF